MFVRVINFAESFVRLIDLIFRGLKELNIHTVLPAKSDSDIMSCLQSYQGL